MNTPFLNFDPQHAPIKHELLKAVEEVIDSNYLVLGQKTVAFEEAFAKYAGTTFAVGISNGLDALILSLQALEVGKNDEVLVPSNTYIATWLAVTAVGAIPIPVEPDPDTYNIDPKKLEAAITDKTKAIMPVHLYGQASAMTSIMEIANKYALYVVEDCAQGHGTTWEGQTIGSFGHANAFSFYPTKNLGAIGEAGAVTTNNEQLAIKIQQLRNYGQTKKYHNAFAGSNKRIDEVQAAFLLVKMQYMEQWTQQRKQAAALYQQALDTKAELILPKTIHGAEHVWHLYVIRHPERDRLQEYLNNQGIGTLIHYPIPPHLQEAYQSLGYQKGDFPIAEEIADTALSLPLYPGITEEDVLSIAETINKF